MNQPRSAAAGVHDPGVGHAVERTFVPGLVGAALALAMYGGVALSVDFPRASGGIHSDEATYYMMAHSLVEDGDLAYRREDLVRVWREFPGGPTGVFLKKGRDIVDAGLMLRPPFFWTTTADDTDPTRLFYGKAFIYPLVASPFVAVFGTGGFLLLNAVLLALVIWCGYVFLHARMPPAPAALLAGAFVMATVVPVYYVWIAPELFNFALGLLAYFCWLYKEVEVPGRAPRGMRWLFGPASDVVAAVLLGMATFSKVTSALLFPPIALWMLWRRQWRRSLTASAAFAVVAAGLFGINMAISGEWNFQGGQRATFVHEFPFQTPGTGFFGPAHGRDEAMTDVIFNRSVFFTNLVHNFKWYFVGRYGGLVAYFFPAVFALAAFLLRPRRRPGWHYLVLGAAFAQIVLFIITVPYTWFGGGGSVGNRYFMGVYGLFLFLMPAVRHVGLALVPWAIGLFFMAKLVLNPFATSIRPGEYADHGPLRWFPVELSNVNDLPINTNESRVRVWFGANPGENDLGFQIYFLDKNAHGREADEKAFWVRGRSRAEFLVKTDRVMRRLVLNLTAGAVPTTVKARVSGRSQEVSLAAGQRHQIVFSLGPGYPYEGRWVWTASVSSSDGFVPLFHDGSEDTRYLGVRVKPTLQ